MDRTKKPRQRGNAAEAKSRRYAWDRRGQEDTATAGARTGHWGHYAELRNPAPNLDFDIDVARSVYIRLVRARQRFVCVRHRRRVGLLCCWGGRSSASVVKRHPEGDW